MAKQILRGQLLYYKNFYLDIIIRNSNSNWYPRQLTTIDKSIKWTNFLTSSKINHNEFLCRFSF